MAALWLILAVAVPAAAAYGLSLWRHPWTSCRRCRGGGKSRDRIWRGAHGTCPSCGGKGRHPRLGVRVLTPARARGMTAAKGTHRITDKRRPR